MRQGRFSTGLLLGMTVWGVLLWTVTPSSAAPPVIGKTSNSSWTENFWPSFSTTTLAAPSEPRFLKSARVGMARTWNGVQRTTRSAWETTKDVLRPYDPPQKTRKSQVRRKTDEGGFWSNLLGGQEPQDREVTVNDFLRQPAPQ